MWMAKKDRVRVRTGTVYAEESTIAQHKVLEVLKGDSLFVHGRISSKRGYKSTGMVSSRQNYKETFMMVLG